MGIGATALGYIHESLFLACSSSRFAGLEMCELGDQTLHLKGWLEPPNMRILAKTYFDRLGFSHTSIDLHGKRGSIPLDLSKPITDEKYLNRFDVLTNLGFSEHVDNQYECFKNIHNLVKPGGIFIHILPLTQWESRKTSLGVLVGKKGLHCPYFYTREFVFNLCKSNNYYPISIQILPFLGGFGCCFAKIHNNEF